MKSPGATRVVEDGEFRPSLIFDVPKSCTSHRPAGSLGPFQITRTFSGLRSRCAQWIFSAIPTGCKPSCRNLSAPARHAAPYSRWAGVKPRLLLLKSGYFPLKYVRRSRSANGDIMLKSDPCRNAVKLCIIFWFCSRHRLKDLRFFCSATKNWLDQRPWVLTP